MPFSPALTVSVRDVNSNIIKLTGDDRKLVKYHSMVKGTLSARAQGGAAMNLDTYIVRNGTQTGYGEEWSLDLPVESNVFTFSAEDSEGRIGTYTYVADMVDYIKPTCNAVRSRPSATGEITLSCYGDFFNGDFGEKKNIIYADYQYREKGGTWSEWRTMSIDAVGNKYYAYTSLSGLDYQKTYEFNFSANDLLMQVTTSMSNVRSLPHFHWGENNIVFEVPTTFNSDTRMKGNLLLKGDGNFGNYLRFGDGDYCYLAELTDDNLTIKATTINLDTSNLTQKGKSVKFAESGTWTPTIDDYVVSYYNSQSGWYSKVGNVVTVGFYIKARCIADEIIETSEIFIQGLPYSPSAASAGGGMCSGAYMPQSGSTKAKNFQCYVAETGGYISTRAQACDNTANAFLQTSASGCMYPAGGELTLSGTITYMTN